MSATEGLVVAHGYWHFTIADIQTATGLATSTFYFYFPTKLAAVLAAFQRVVDALDEVASRQYPERSEYERIVLANHAY
ncbi:MAG TPA: TetR/AcrR family transcriptional regulator, partial [Tepidiformaceae bacterium]|nr:TetR/AcrR family transcriptional regulator [Tepidiformaceae bacterium]